MDNKITNRELRFIQNLHVWAFTFCGLRVLVYSCFSHKLEVDRRYERCKVIQECSFFYKSLCMRVYWGRGKKWRRPTHRESTIMFGIKDQIQTDATGAERNQCIRFNQHSIRFGHMWAIRYEISSNLSDYLFGCKAARWRFALQSYRRTWCHTGFLMLDGFMELVPLEKVVVMLVVGVINVFCHFFDTKDDLESLLWLQFCLIRWSLLVPFFF